jgi:RNA polymerase sigma factor (sigma-70 family)
MRKDFASPSLKLVVGQDDDKWRGATGMWSKFGIAITATYGDAAVRARILPTDEELVAAFKGGDVRAFDTLFDRYGQRIFGYVYRSVSDPALAEELTQDIFLKVFLHLRRTATDTTFKAWIYRIATTTCIDAYRTAARRPVPVRDEEALALVVDRAAGDPEQRAIQREQRRAVQRTLDALPAHYRQALILRQLQGLAYAEIGEALGVTVEAVTSLIHRARQAFRVVYSRQEQETER